MYKLVLYIIYYCSLWACISHAFCHFGGCEILVGVLGGFIIVPFAFFAVWMFVIFSYIKNVNSTGTWWV